VATASADASTSAFHLGIGIAGILMIVGGAVSGFGIQNPRRHPRSSFQPVGERNDDRGRAEAVPTRGAAAAGECGHGAEADCSPAEPAAEPA
jgi:hypothetical protein